GNHDENIREIERRCDVRVAMTGTGVTIAGDDVATQLASRVLSELYGVAEQGMALEQQDIARAIDILSHSHTATLKEVLLAPVLSAAGGRRIAPKTVGQKRYVELMRNHDVVFAIGPAGTGKTYLAVAMAVSDLLAGTYSRIILTRPAVEAGEKLGFLPGDLAEKVNPYLRPLYDALHDMIGLDRAHRMVEDGTVEVAPLAFMRGRTLNRAFVILDEAQNTTREQMKMFLTRLGSDSKAIITGDVTQVDLGGTMVSGLRDARRVLGGIKDIAFVSLDDRDVVRHPLVRAIIGAYEEADDD
ncbi:PhoH family protein, partial [Pseudomonas sp.]|uniref:PhoH family protein n=1 Tax=Pseudomonas sp. TaxID=306 RepID=UPI003981A4F2